ncbi:hypothetical protein [Streptomyces sp. NPDC008125]|uniref:hypothetical protein n=1 Tax=Streptomyces sp. NPDC008125 TaxID=3364811 RepID=UPI0036E451E6
MSKQKKGRRHRSVNRTPRPASRQDDSLHSCLPHQSRGPAAAVYRDEAELVDGRAYPATSRLTLDGEQMRFDLIANMHAVTHGEVTGPCADMLTALALTYLESQPTLLAAFGPGDEALQSTTKLTESFRRFFQEGVLGVDTKGGYVNFERLHAAHA